MSTQKRTLHYFSDLCSRCCVNRALLLLQERGLLKARERLRVRERETPTHLICGIHHGSASTLTFNIHLSLCLDQTSYCRRVSARGRCHSKIFTSMHRSTFSVRISTHSLSVPLLASFGGRIRTAFRMRLQSLLQRAWWRCKT